MGRYYDIMQVFEVIKLLIFTPPVIIDYQNPAMAYDFFIGKGFGIGIVFSGDSHVERIISGIDGLRHNIRERLGAVIVGSRSAAYERDDYGRVQKNNIRITAGQTDFKVGRLKTIILQVNYHLDGIAGVTE